VYNTIAVSVWRKSYQMRRMATVNSSGLTELLFKRAHFGGQIWIRAPFGDSPVK